MDFQSIIIGIAVIAVCFFPYIYNTNKGKKRDQKFFQMLLDKAQQLKCNITTHEVAGNIIIGLDSETKELFFLKRTKTFESLQHLNLSEIKNIKLNNESRMVGSKENMRKVFDKLQLVFTPLDSDKKEIVFEFYNSDETLIMNGELFLIEKWAKIVNENFKPQSVLDKISSKSLTKTFA